MRRMALDQVVLTKVWSTGDGIFVLAATLSKYLHMNFDPGSLVHESYVSLMFTDYPSSTLTYGALANYFWGIAKEQPAEHVLSQAGQVLASQVTVWIPWMMEQIDIAKQQYGLITESTPANDASIQQLAVNAPAVAAKPAPSDHDQLALLKLQGNHLSATNASKLLEIEQRKRLEAEDKIHLLSTRLKVITFQLSEAQDRLAQQEALLKLAVRSQQQHGETAPLTNAFFRCTDPLHPLHSPEIARAFSCWNDLTDGGTINKAEKRGRGVHLLVDDWVKDNKIIINDEQRKRLKATVSWRKKGAGAVSKK